MEEILSTSNSSTIYCDSLNNIFFESDYDSTQNPANSSKSQSERGNKFALNDI